MDLLNQLNREYIERHTLKEDAFWANKMGLKSYQPGTFEQHEIELKSWTTAPTYMASIKKALAASEITDDARVGLEGWQHFFRINVMDHPKAKALAEELITMEGKLGAARGAMKLGYIDPETHSFVPSSNGAMSLMLATTSDERLRKAAWNGLRAIGDYVLNHGFLEVVKKRNELAKVLGYADYYDYKVQITEGFSKDTLFAILDDLELNTRDAVQKSMDTAATTLGEDARKPWNFAFYTSGTTKVKADPYLGFSTAIERWGKSFAAMGIEFANATLRLDLVNRQGKEENGFMHGPYPAWVDQGVYQPARINFTANAIPGAVGSGWDALHTLFHEGGHAAHFSNIRMPAPCFGQEFAPTSVAFAETQSMFLESVVTDPDWLRRYAIDAKGQTIPVSLIKDMKMDEFRFRAKMMRSMLGVSYSEKALYEMSEAELTPENVKAAVSAIEQRMHCQEAAPRPILSIPHLLSGEASAYYHGYILAEMAVYQTRAYFLKKYGFITDNLEVGPELREAYWRLGNRKTFLDFVKDLTGEPFSAKETITLVNKPLDEVLTSVDKSIAAIQKIPRWTVPINLRAKIQMVHGDHVIASSENAHDFESMANTYAAWIQNQVPKN
ncbi:MAG: peptidase M3 [Chitinophagaceae bacterium]|nr:peptidase M3 [Oligoflexus sp.]